MRNPISLDISVKNAFFDTPAVMTALDRAERKALSRIGAFVRTGARRSLRRRKRISSPGKTPSVRSTDPFATLKNIPFVYEPNRASVVIGPVRINSSKRRGISGTVPELHEFGGRVSIVEERSRNRQGDWFRVDPSSRRFPWKERRRRNAVYPSRPFMGPALDTEIRKGTITDAWKASVSR